VRHAKKSYDLLQALNRASKSNGKGLDKAVLDSALDDLIETFKDVNKKLDDLLAKATEYKRCSPRFARAVFQDRPIVLAQLQSAELL